jgi:hypothetical protein
MKPGRWVRDTCKFRYRADAGESSLPYHRTDPNHRSIVSAIAVQATLVTTRNNKPNPNIASARYSVATVPPTPTTKAHVIRPMRRMFSWKRRFILEGCWRSGMGLLRGSASYGKPYHRRSRGPSE